MYGDLIGMAGLFCRDLDGDGREEILAGASSMEDWWNDYWYVLRYEPSDGSLRRLFTGPFDTATVVKILVVPAHQGSESDIWVISWSGRWDIYSGTTFGLLKSGWLPFSPNDAALVDWDGDGREELIAASDTETAVFSSQTFEPLIVLPEGGRVMVVGRFGPSSQACVALGRLESGVFLDLQTGSILWTCPSPFGDVLLTADFDGDGRDEVIANPTGMALQGLDPQEYRVAWEVPRPRGTEGLDLFDITSDGVAEIVFADDQWGDLYALDLGTRDVVWTVPNKEAFGMIRMAVGDPDGDGMPDLIRSIRGTWRDEVPCFWATCPRRKLFGLPAGWRVPSPRRPSGTWTGTTGKKSSSSHTRHTECGPRALS